MPKLDSHYDAGHETQVPPTVKRIVGEVLASYFISHTAEVWNGDAGS